MNHDITEKVEEYYQPNLKTNMDNGILKLSLENVKSAIVYGLLAVALFVISKGSVFGLDWHALVDVGVLGLLTSLVKNLLTTNEGNFVGLVGVK